MLSKLYCKISKINRFLFPPRKQKSWQASSKWRNLSIAMWHCNESSLSAWSLKKGTEGIPHINMQVKENQRGLHSEKVERDREILLYRIDSENHVNAHSVPHSISVTPPLILFILTYRRGPSIHITLCWRGRKGAGREKESRRKMDRQSSLKDFLSGREVNKTDIC